VDPAESSYRSVCGELRANCKVLGVITSLHWYWQDFGIEPGMVAVARLEVNTKVWWNDAKIVILIQRGRCERKSLPMIAGASLFAGSYSRTRTGICCSLAPRFSRRHWNAPSVAQTWHFFDDLGVTRKCPSKRASTLSRC